MPFIAGCWIVGGRHDTSVRADRARRRAGSKATSCLVQGLPDRLLPDPVHHSGVSRSGATILGAELLGVDRRAATLFTFLSGGSHHDGASILELHHKAGELTMAKA